MKHPDCDEIRPLMSPSLDHELPAEKDRHVAAHLTVCSVCLAEFNGIRRGRELAATLTEVDPPQSLKRDLFTRLARKQAASAPQAVTLRRLAFAAAAAAVVLLAVGGIWQWSKIPDGSLRGSTSIVAAGDPLYLERLTEVLGREPALQAITAQYHLREVNVEEALRRASFKVLCPLEAEPGEALNEHHLTELRACPLVHVSALRGDHRVVVLEQPAGWPIVYGGARVEHVTIAGQPCDRLQIGDHAIIKWERGGTRSIVVASADNPEMTKVARALISASS